MHTDLKIFVSGSTSDVRSSSPDCLTDGLETDLTLVPLSPKSDKPISTCRGSGSYETAFLPSTLSCSYTILFSTLTLRSSPSCHPSNARRLISILLLNSNSSHTTCSISPRAPLSSPKHHTEMNRSGW